MNNQEAIEIIRTAVAEVEWEYPMNYAAAFDMAIEALERQDATEPISPLNPTWSSLHFCGKCMYPVGRYNYCPQCGRKVKWNGQSDG